MKTNKWLVEYARAQIGLPYWYGTFGQKSTSTLLKQKKAQYPSMYGSNDYTKQLGVKVHDCVGLIKGALWCDTTTGTPKYSSAQDKSAVGMYIASKEKGKIKTFPKKLGLLVYKAHDPSDPSSIHHVGIFDGVDTVIEAKGHAYGVVRTTFKPSDWDFWSQCPFTTAESTTIPCPEIVYYKKCASNISSITDALKSIGEKDVSLSHRRKIAVANGIVKSGVLYVGTAYQNTLMLSLLKIGKLIKA